MLQMKTVWTLVDDSVGGSGGGGGTQAQHFDFPNVHNETFSYWTSQEEPSGSPVVIAAILFAEPNIGKL